AVPDKAAFPLRDARRQRDDLYPLAGQQRGHDSADLRAVHPAIAGRRRQLHVLQQQHDTQGLVHERQNRPRPLELVVLGRLWRPRRPVYFLLHHRRVGTAEYGGEPPETGRVHPWYPPWTTHTRLP